jgi:cytochrome c oxidase subunit 4
MSHHPDEVRRHVRVYVNVFLALLVLTVVTVAVSYVHLAVPLAVTAALIIATVKGSLVASYFMHLINERRMIFGALILTAVFVLALVFLPLLGLSDQLGTPVQIDGVKGPPGAAQGH